MVTYSQTVMVTQRMIIWNCCIQWYDHTSFSKTDRLSSIYILHTHSKSNFINKIMQQSFLTWWNLYLNCEPNLVFYPKLGPSRLNSFFATLNGPRNEDSKNLEERIYIDLKNVAKCFSQLLKRTYILSKIGQFNPLKFPRKLSVSINWPLLCKKNKNFLSVISYLVDKVEVN